MAASSQQSPGMGNPHQTCSNLLLEGHAFAQAGENLGFPGQHTPQLTEKPQESGQTGPSTDSQAV